MNHVDVFVNINILNMYFFLIEFTTPIVQPCGSKQKNNHCMSLACVFILAPIKMLID